ncbi:site-specific integrase [Nocardia amamiensis]|uniref:Site-specific integrase n=1 Tax=Nocardia amamiensis TaxID=404578 RepID=A0ABS0CVX6_9NOCA|nr:site-specific integrase [Nocardia amamiensis]MBF6298994.1 site-specific integrase [Nocardia amamiensis]
MDGQIQVIPLGVSIRGDIEFRGKVGAHRARVRWTDPVTKRRASRSESFATREAAEAWIEQIEQAAARGVDPKTATATLAEYGNAHWDTAMRGVEPKTLDPYRAGWRLRIVPTLGHLPVTMITTGLADRAVSAWIADGCGESTIKNTLAALGRVMDQAVRDEVIDRNRVDVGGWQRQLAKHEDELDNPRALALPDWSTLQQLSAALVAASAGRYQGWGDVVKFAACTATRIGEVSGCRIRDIDTEQWVWTLRRQTTPGPGGMRDKRTKGKRARPIPLIEEIRPLILRRINAARTRVDSDPALHSASDEDRREAFMSERLFVGPRGGRIATGVLRDATHWDDVVAQLGYEHLRRHDLRHTGLTWFADAGVPLHRLQRIAGHTDPRITQRYLHPDVKALQNDGQLLSRFLTTPNSGPQIPELLARMGPGHPRETADGPKLVPRLRVVE